MITQTPCVSTGICICITCQKSPSPPPADRSSGTNKWRPHMYPLAQDSRHCFWRCCLSPWSHCPLSSDSWRHLDLKNCLQKGNRWIHMDRRDENTQLHLDLISTNNHKAIGKNTWKMDNRRRNDDKKEERKWQRVKVGNEGQKIGGTR